jgi:D-alanyl-D-alanine carboxypeptidase
MESAELAAHDPRVRAILTDPDAYFSAALRRAWPQAGADIQAVLDRRARARHNGARGPVFLQLFLRSVWPWRSFR